MADLQVPDWAKRPLPSMPPGDAAKMRELYPEDKGELKAPSWTTTPAWATTVPAQKTPVWAAAPKTTQKPPAWAVPAQSDGYASKLKNQLSEGGKAETEALTELLKEKPLSIAGIGELGSHAAKFAGGATQAVLAPATAGVAQAAQSTGAARALARYVAEKIGASPEQAEEIARKLEGSTAEQIGGALTNATAIAAGGRGGAAEKPAVPGREPPVIEKPVVVTPEGVKSGGASHEEIQAGAPESQRKFQANTGKVVGREEGAKIAEQSGQVLPGKGVTPGKLRSEDLPGYKSQIFSSDKPIASTKPITSTEGVADKLYQSRQAVRADYKEFSQWAKPLKNVPKDFWRKALDHLDDPENFPFTPQEQVIFDRSIKPMKDEIDAARKEISASGFDPKYLDTESEGLGGAIRQRKGAGTPMDRLTGVKGTSRAPEGGKSLSRSAGTFKSRNMMVLTKDGKRTIVHIDDEGNVFDAAKKGDPIGSIDEAGAVAGGGKLSEATRKEIESATKGEVKYHDNAFGVYGTTLLQTRRALRSVRLLNDIKKSPDINIIARGPMSKGEIPKGWKEIPDTPEFRGWRFEPHYAEEIEDFLHGMKRDAGALSRLDRLNRFTLNLLFWANPIHAYNITDAFLVTKGIGNLAKDLPGTTSDLLKSVKSVATRDKYNMAQARAGIPMPGLDTAGEEFRRMTLDIMGVKARQDPQNFLQFIKRFGFDKPADFFNRIGEVSHKAVFAWQDVLQQTLERGYMRQGLSQAEATEKAAKTFMNYRTPSRVMDQRWMGQALQGQAWMDFPKYSYGRLKGMYEILKDSAKLDPHAIDQLLTIAALYEFGKYAINPLVKKYTGQDNAEFGNFGYTVFPDLADKLAEGQRTPGQAMQSLFSPGYMMQGIDLASGVNRYLGKSVSTPGEDASEIGWDYASEIANKLSPMQRFGQVARGQVTPEDLWLEQLGVKFPGDPSDSKTVRRQLKAREKYGSPLEQELGQ